MSCPVSLQECSRSECNDGCGHVGDTAFWKPSLESWWKQTALTDHQAFGPKLAEYGARDLIAHGRAIESMRQSPDAPLSDAGAGELGCMFYLHGKLARAMEAYSRGELPSADTLHDITVYSLMARAYRERGKLT